MYIVECKHTSIGRAGAKEMTMQQATSGNSISSTLMNETEV
jgi:hypothetical protein